MKSSTQKYISLGIVVAVILALLIYFNQGGKENEFDWSETYDEKSKEPFGSLVIHDILKTYFPNQSFQDLTDNVSKALPVPDSLKGKSNYVFIGDGFLLDTVDTDKLLLFIHEGNNAFVSANVLPNYFMKAILMDSCNEGSWEYSDWAFEYSDTLNLNFKHPQLIENQSFSYPYLVRGEMRSRDWSFIDTVRNTCIEGTQNLTILGDMNDEHINFIRLHYGRGDIYLHTNPLVFTNFYMLDSAKLRYSSKVFSHLPEGDIFWDTKSRVNRDILRKMNGGNPRMDKDGPLKYILAQPSLRWAWFIFLALIALYLLFAAKRKQRIIPVLEEKSNTSLDFIQTIGHMYFLQGDHIRLCDMMLKQFQTYVREKYHLASREMNEEFVSNLSLKSDIPSERIKRIVEYENLIYRNSITEQSMVEFYHILSNFYKVCK